METVKPWWQSLTMWAGIVAFIYGVLGMFDIQFGVEQSVVVDTIMALVGAVVMYGRKRATAEIAPLLPTSGA